MGEPEFLKLLPADVRRVGPIAAMILALIRYETAGNGEQHGRHTLDGAMWWQASHSEIGEELGGISRKTILAAASKLESQGELLTCVLVTNGDRTKAYRVPDQPKSETGQPLTSQSPKRDNLEGGLSETGQGLSETGQGVVPNGTLHYLLPELPEVTEEKAAARACEPNSSLSAVSATPGANLVRQIIPSKYPASEQTMLRIKASAALHEGHPTDVVADTLRLYLDKPHVSARAFDCLLAEVYKIRDGPGRNSSRIATADLRVAAILARKTDQPQRKEIT